ncbi:unnamed protein product, partial [Nesidiocoris tenuis]
MAAVTPDNAQTLPRTARQHGEKGGQDLRDDGRWRRRRRRRRQQAGPGSRHRRPEDDQRQLNRSHRRYVRTHPAAGRAACALPFPVIVKACRTWLYCYPGHLPPFLPGCWRRGSARWEPTVQFYVVGRPRRVARKSLSTAAILSGFIAVLTGSAAVLAESAAVSTGSTAVSASDRQLSQP